MLVAKKNVKVGDSESEDEIKKNQLVGKDEKNSRRPLSVSGALLRQRSRRHETLPPVE